MELNIFKLNEDVPSPAYGSSMAACFDLSAYLSFQSSVKAYTKTNKQLELLVAQESGGRDFIEIPSEWRVLIPTGLIFDIPESASVRVYARSGLSTKQGLNLINCVGIVDCDYVEEIFVPLYNNSQEKIRIYNGDRIAQAELVYNTRAIINYTDTRPIRKSDRSGGFGSTGIS